MKILQRLILPLATKVGYFNPVIILGCVCIAIGGGLLTTLTVDIPSPKMIGLQFLLGSGFGAIIQTVRTQSQLLQMPLTFSKPLIAVQAVLPLSLVSTATSVLVLCQFLGGSIFLSLAANLFESNLRTDLTESLSATSAQSIIKMGAGAVRHVVSGQELFFTLRAYNSAIATTFVSELSVPLAIHDTDAVSGWFWRAVLRHWWRPRSCNGAVSRV
jgi:hypothetical protein